MEKITSYMDEWTTRFLKTIAFATLPFVLLDFLPFISWRYMTLLPFIFFGVIIRMALLWSREEHDLPSEAQIEERARKWAIVNAVFLTVVLALVAMIPLPSLREALRGVMLFYIVYLFLALGIAYLLTKYTWLEMIKLADRWEL